MTLRYELITWDDRFKLDVPIIDDQHKQLVVITNSLHMACLECRDTASRLFILTARDVANYVRYHFSTEERLMTALEYPAIHAHKKQHESFVFEILTRVKQFEEGKKFVPNQFVYYLKDWILSHIALTDKEFADFFINLKQSGKLDKYKAMLSIV